MKAIATVTDDLQQLLFLLYICSTLNTQIQLLAASACI